MFWRLKFRRLFGVSCALAHDDVVDRTLSHALAGGIDSDKKTRAMAKAAYKCDFQSEQITGILTSTIGF